MILKENVRPNNLLIQSRLLCHEISGMLIQPFIYKLCIFVNILQFREMTAVLKFYDFTGW